MVPSLFRISTFLLFNLHSILHKIMPVFTECSSSSASVMAEQAKVRRPAMLPRIHFFPDQTFPSPEADTDTDPIPIPIPNLNRNPHVSRSSKSHIISSLSLSHFSNNTDTDPIPIPIPIPISNLNQNPHVSRSSKPNSVSSLFLSHFSNTSPEPSTLFTTKKKGTAAFRGLGCTAGAAQQVSVPAVIRSSAEWKGKRVKKKKNPQQYQKRKKESFKLFSENGVGESSNSYGSNGDGNCLAVPDVWCGPRIGFSADSVVGSVDCVVASSAASRNVGSISGRGKIDGDKIINPRERERERERSSCPPRRAAVNRETLSFLDADRAFSTSRPEQEVFGTQYCRHVRHPSPDGLAEILMLQNSFIMGGRLDRFSNWRLDIDHMSYEQLLELGDKIGYVNTGLKENDFGRCVQKVKLSILNELAARSLISGDKKCSVCQEEYEEDDELGLLKCGHGFHIRCIKQWLSQKNACPVCKTEPVARG